MTTKNRTKLLAVLAITAMALMPVFALLDSDDSSADGSHDVSVSNWGEFKTTMNNARDNPGDTYNVTMNSPAESAGIIVLESITIPANVNLTIPAENILNLLEGEIGGAKLTVINEGNIIMDPHGSPFGQAGGIYAAGNNITFINRNTITAETSSSIMCMYGANFVNDGSIVSKMWNFNFTKSGGLTNYGEIVLSGSGSCLLQMMSPFVNWGTVSGEGAIITEQTSVVNIGTITCRVLGEVKQESAVWDASKAGKLISSEGYKLNVKDSDINEALAKLGDKTVEGLLQEAVNSVMGGGGTSATISDVTVDLELSSNYAEAEYINNLTLRTAFFKVHAGMKVQGEINAQLPDEGTYSFNDKPATSAKTLKFNSSIRLEGLLRINAYFDAGENLQRVDIILGTGLSTLIKTDFRMDINNDEKQYEISYRSTDYEFGMGLNIMIGLDFKGFDLLSHNPGDKWNIEGTIKVADAKGHIDITASKNVVELIDYTYVGEKTEETKKQIQELLDNGKTTIDLNELFDLLFGTGGAVGAPVASSSGAAMAPVGASAAMPAVNGLFDSFIFTASATMGEDGYVTLEEGPVSTGAIDIGAVIFDRLEEEGETSIMVNTEVSGDSMTTMFTGAVAVLTGASQEDINGVLKDLGANYTESNMKVSEMDRICDQTMRNIDKMGGRDDSNNTTLYVMIGLVSVLAVLIAIPMFIRRN